MALPLLAWNERRRLPRFPTLSPIRFEWETPGGDLLRARGITRDVSQRGVYSYIEHPLSVGLDVAFDVAVPLELAVNQEPVMFHCRGRVLRCERFHSRFGVAVSIVSHRLFETARCYPRAYARIAPESTVVARLAGAQAEVRDLSPAGAFISDCHLLAVGSMIELWLHAKEWKAPIEVNAIVRRVEPETGMAVEFVALTAAVYRQLRALVRETAR